MAGGQGPKDPFNDPADDWFDLLDDPPPTGAATPGKPARPASVDATETSAAHPPEDISRKVTPVVGTPASRPPSTSTPEPDDDVWNWELPPAPAPSSAPAALSQSSPPDAAPSPWSPPLSVSLHPQGTASPEKVTPRPPATAPSTRGDFDLDDVESWQFDPTALRASSPPPTFPTVVPGLPPSLTAASSRPTADFSPAEGPPTQPPPSAPMGRTRQATLGYASVSRPTPLVPADVPAQAKPTPIPPPPLPRASDLMPAGSAPEIPRARVFSPEAPQGLPPREGPPRLPRAPAGSRAVPMPRTSVQVPPPSGISLQGSSRRSPSIPPSPRRDMHDRFDLGDFTGALNIADAMLAADPGDTDALGVADVSRARLRAIYASRLGSLLQVPVLVVPHTELRWLALDNRSAFVLSLIDGISTLEDILDVSAMAPLEALRILYNLTTQRVISLQQGRRY